MGNMRKLHKGTCILCLIFLSLSVVFQAEANDTPYYSYRIVNTFPHNTNSFTQGLIYYEGYLYEGTGEWGESKLMKVNLESGEAVQLIDLDNQFFGEGITLFNEEIIQLTWLSNVGFVYNKHSFELVRQVQYPTEGWGLTHDGTQLIMSDGTEFLYFRDAATFEEKKRLEVLDGNTPIIYLNELEFVEGEVWANVWFEDFIARISPATGKVLGWIDLRDIRENNDLPDSAGVLNGIAYDSLSKRIFITGKDWPKLFEIEILENKSSVRHWLNQK